MKTIETLSDATLVYLAAMALAFVVERLLEVLKAAFDLADSTAGWHGAWTARTEAIATKLQRRLARLGDAERPAAALLYRFTEMNLTTQGGYSGTLPLLSGDLVRSLGVRVAAKLLAVSFGIGLAMWLQVDLLAAFAKAGGESPWWVPTVSDQAVRWALSGAAIGLGTTPLHKLITSLERASARRRAQEVARG
jgi:hypothetical protein